MPSWVRVKSEPWLGCFRGQINDQASLLICWRRSDLSGRRRRRPVRFGHVTRIFQRLRFLSAGGVCRPTDRSICCPTVFPELILSPPPPLPTTTGWFNNTPADEKIPAVFARTQDHVYSKWHTCSYCSYCCQRPLRPTWPTDRWPPRPARPASASAKNSSWTRSCRRLITIATSALPASTAQVPSTSEPTHHCHCCTCHFGRFLFPLRQHVPKDAYSRLCILVWHW